VGAAHVIISPAIPERNRPSLNRRARPFQVGKRPHAHEALLEAIRAFALVGDAPFKERDPPLEGRIFWIPHAQHLNCLKRALAS